MASNCDDLTLSIFLYLAVGSPIWTYMVIIVSLKMHITVMRTCEDIWVRSVTVMKLHWIERTDTVNSLHSQLMTGKFRKSDVITDLFYMLIHYHLNINLTLILTITLLLDTLVINVCVRVTSWQCDDSTDTKLDNVVLWVTGPFTDNQLAFSEVVDWSTRGLVNSLKRLI